jgi:hypothetical protein
MQFSRKANIKTRLLLICIFDHTQVARSIFAYALFQRRKVNGIDTYPLF